MDGAKKESKRIWGEGNKQNFVSPLRLSVVAPLALKMTSQTTIGDNSMIHMKRVRDLRTGDTVVSENGSTRKVVGNPQPCVARGYVYVRTDNPDRPINMHGDFTVQVEVK